MFASPAAERGTIRPSIRPLRAPGGAHRGRARPTRTRRRAIVGRVSNATDLRAMAGRLALLLGLLGALALGGPRPASADDVQLVQVVEAHVATLKPEATTLQQRLERFSRAPTNRNRATLAARSAERVEAEASSLRLSLRRTTASSTQGRRLRADLLSAVNVVRSATGTLGTGLRRVAARRATFATLRQLQRAATRLERGMRDGERVASRIAAAVTGG